MHCTNPQNICMLYNKHCEGNKPGTKIETNRWQPTFDKVIQNDLRKRPLSWGLEGASHSKRERNAPGSKKSIWKRLRKFLHMVQVVKDQCGWSIYMRGRWVQWGCREGARSQSELHVNRKNLLLIRFCGSAFIHISAVMSPWIFLRRGIIAYYEELLAGGKKKCMEVEQTIKAVAGTRVNYDDGLN